MFVRFARRAIFTSASRQTMQRIRQKIPTKETLGFGVYAIGFLVHGSAFGHIMLHDSWRDSSYTVTNVARVCVNAFAALVATFVWPVIDFGLVLMCLVDEAYFHATGRRTI